MIVFYFEIRFHMKYCSLRGQHRSCMNIIVDFHRICIIHIVINPIWWFVSNVVHNYLKGYFIERKHSKQRSLYHNSLQCISLHNAQIIRCIKWIMQLRNSCIPHCRNIAILYSANFETFSSLTPHFGVFKWKHCY